MHSISKLLLSLFLVLFIVSCASQKAGKDSLVKPLRYENPGKTLKYQSSTEFQQVLEIQGNKVNIVYLADNQFSMAPQPGDGELTFDVTIDNFEASYKTPQGETKVDPSTVVGKSFEMKMYADGKEISYGNIDDIKFNSPNGEQGISMDFKAMFPDLPSVVNDEGQTWETKDTVIEISDKNNVKLIIALNNTFVGYETFKSRKCMKVQTDGDIIMDAVSKENGQDMKITGKFKGKGYYYFDSTNGIYVGEEFNADGEGVIKVLTQNMDIPFKRSFKKKIMLAE